jgi:tRNA threonylcarbamoyl adenosine modification protein (Sua5/YciO/YrdC/YwlC family)
MSAIFLEINQDNIDARKIQQIVQTLQDGGVIVYPTDSVYALACDMNQRQGIEKLCRIKNIQVEKALLSFVCNDLAMVSNYSRGIDTSIYRLLKRNTPGPFTFILKAGSSVPAVMGKRKTIGFRIPENKISTAIVEQLGYPLLSISLHNEDDDILEYFSDPREIYSRYESICDLIIDGGAGKLTASGLIDLSEGTVEIIREGEKIFE